MNMKQLVSQSVNDREQLQKEIARLQLLRQIATLAANTRDRIRLQNESLKLLQEFYQLSGCGIYQLHDLAAPFNLVSSLGISKKLIRELQRVPAGKGLIAQVAKSRIPHNWVDLHGETELYCKVVLDDNWCSLLAHPLMAHERLIGILFLFDRRPRQFCQADIDLIGHCCQLLAAAFDSSELVEKLEWQHRLTHASQRELDRSRQQLREHVNRLEESNRSLEQANRMKDRFLALASHELRTPLTWILTATEMLESQFDDLPQETGSLLATIFKGGRRLNSLVEDLLEMARIEARDIYLAQESIDLQLLLGELKQNYGDEALRRQLKLEIGEVPGHLSPIGDHHHLRQSLERILKNALKFTPPGGFVRIEASHCTVEELLQRRAEMEPFCPEFFHRTPLRDHINICISDSGIGIAEQDRLQIFDKFHGAGDISLHGKHQHSVQGPSAGLGLPLAKGMIEAHGGMIWVEGRPDAESGSNFHILLPLYRPNRQHGQ